jgi:hypothetical protein
MRRLGRGLGLWLLVVVVSVGASCATREGGSGPWWQSRRDASGQAPDPGATPEAVLQVYAARAAGWRGALAVHTWIALKRSAAPAYVGRAVPELRLDLPPTAIGKDYLPGGAIAGRPPGGRGVQVSLRGLGGALAGWEEGVEVNLLGLTLGLDVKEPALRLPALGRVGRP